VLSGRALGLGLISQADRTKLRDRHILDSLRGRDCLLSEDREIVDLGSGAGLPGIPLAIAEPERSFALVEGRRKAVAFLELAVEELGLSNTVVVAGRAEDSELEADLCVARAVAVPLIAWRLASAILRPGGRLLYYAGRSWRAESCVDSTVDVTICCKGAFPWQGPLVIIRRR